MTNLKWLVRIVLFLALCFVGAFLHYTLPSTSVVQVTRTDVKRMDEGSDRHPSDGIAIRTRDVRFINTVTRGGSVRVYRNEDTGWGWPPYFKFDSADFTAKATSADQVGEARVGGDHLLWLADPAALDVSEHHRLQVGAQGLHATFPGSISRSSSCSPP